MSASTVAASVAEIAALVPEAPPGVGPSGEVIAAAVAVIAERFRPERITLFGSRAYGVPTAESDVDLLVVMETSLSLFEQAWQIRESLGAFADRRLHPTVRTPEQVRIGLAEGDFFYLDAVVSGVSLYSRGDVGMVNGAPGPDGVPGDGPSTLKGATRELLAKATSDFRLAERALAPPDPIWDGACFHAQQGAEKMLKALLQERDVRFPLTHDLVLLSFLVEDVAPNFPVRRDDLKWLSRYAVAVRYSGLDVTEADADRALRIATNIRRIVRAELGLDETSV